MNKPIDKIFVKPVHVDVQVRNPERGGHLDREGEWVPRNSYWYRRKNDGDVVETTPPKKTKTQTTIKE